MNAKLDIFSRLLMKTKFMALKKLYEYDIYHHYTVASDLPSLSFYTHGTLVYVFLFFVGIRHKLIK